MRFDPAAPLRLQYLHRSAAGVWSWGGGKDLAYRFASHAAAEAEAPEHEYVGASGQWRRPFARVLSAEEKEAAAPLPPMPAVRKTVRKAVAVPLRVLAVPPERVFEDLERRHLA